MIFIIYDLKKNALQADELKGGKLKPFKL